ncbi:MAG: epoxyqueuosine reductase QueH [Planctomycetota bacterium]|jgi:predicted adenine nucleotide alpha hydrolase (AANH) superfamily ATPase
MKLLLHICCGPCATYPAKALRDAGHDVHGFFYNPNIHPLAEHGLRLDSARAMLERMGIAATIPDEYDVEKYFRLVAYRESDRCAACYHLRLKRAAGEAARRNVDAFTTSLLVSPYQKHDLIRDIGRSVGMEHGIEFYYEDFRPGWPQTREMSREMGLYRQKYCGCIYSEKERFFASREKRGRNEP